MKMNQDWRNSIFGLKTNLFPKINMRKFDGDVDPPSPLRAARPLNLGYFTSRIQINSLGSFLNPNQLIQAPFSPKAQVLWNP